MKKIAALLMPIVCIFSLSGIPPLTPVKKKKLFWGSVVVTAGGCGAVVASRRIAQSGLMPRFLVGLYSLMIMGGPLGIVTAQAPVSANIKNNSK